MKGASGLMRSERRDGTRTVSHVEAGRSTQPQENGSRDREHDGTGADDVARHQRTDERAGERGPRHASHRREPAREAEEHEFRDHHGAERDGRADGEVDPAEDDDQRRADRRDADHGRVLQHQPLVGPRRERGPDREREADPHGGEREHGAEGAEELAEWLGHNG